MLDALSFRHHISFTHISFPMSYEYILVYICLKISANFGLLLLVLPPKETAMTFSINCNQPDPDSIVCLLVNMYLNICTFADSLFLLHIYSTSNAISFCFCFGPKQIMPFWYPHQYVFFNTVIAGEGAGGGEICTVQKYKKISKSAVSESPTKALHVCK